MVSAAAAFMTWWNWSIVMAGSSWSMLYRSLSVMLKGSLTSGSLSLTTSCLGPDLGPPQFNPNLCDNKVMVTADVCLAYYSDILKRVHPFAILSWCGLSGFWSLFPSNDVQVTRSLWMFLWAKKSAAYNCFISFTACVSLLVWNSVRSFGPATNLNCCFGVSGEQM